MEKRRIQLVGRSTLTVSLPNSWVKKTGLKKGEIVTIIPERDGSLRIFKGEASVEIQKICIIKADLYQEGESIERLIVAGYINGFDIIKVFSTGRLKNNIIEAVREAEFKLIGLNIVEETESYIMLQCSINPLMFPIDVVLRRLYTLFLIMLDEAIQALKDANIELAEDARRREREANRIYLLILRLLNEAQRNPSIAQKIGLNSVEDILTMNIAANILERMADWAEKIAEEIEEVEKKGIGVSEEKKNIIERYAKKIRELTEGAVKSLMSNDAKLANSVANSFKKVLEPEAYKILEENSYSGAFLEAVLLRRIIGNLHRIGEITVGIAEVTIDKSVREMEQFIEKLETKTEKK
ncbi:MAG: phosphate uptake regulator PhoU [Candidatus Bathyarchaeia archaeon]|nr:phosphate uptake regulator PhoU [Candidatus Bathyarchaeota archaeon]